MAIRLKKLLCALIAAALLVSYSFAKPKAKTGFSSGVTQTESSSDTGSDSEEEESAEASWQLLEWEEDYPEWVQKYEVVIEEFKNQKTGFVEINRLLTEDNTTRVQINPFLAPGLYRYKVITYNLLGIPETESDWFEFNIYKAYKPQVRSVENSSTLTSTLYLDEINDGIFTITGRNLFELQEDPMDTSFTNYYLVNAKRNNAQVMVPDILEFSDNNRKLKIQFDMDILDSGTYYFVAEDASGLTNDFNKDSQLIVKFKKAVDFDVSAGYACPIIVVGDKIKEYLNTSVLPITATAKATLIPIKRRFGYFGFGASATYSRLFTDTNGYDLDGNYITGHAIFVYQLPIRIQSKKFDKLRHVATLELHAGAGVAMFQDTKFHFPHNIDSEPLNSLDFSAAAGLTAQIYITNRLYIEAGADFVFPFMGELLMGYVEPKAYVGWQF